MMGEIDGFVVSNDPIADGPIADGSAAADMFNIPDPISAPISAP